MSINRVILSGVIGQYGVKIEWTVAGKPQTAFTLVCEEEGKVSTTFRTFIPVLIVGAQAESLAESLEAWDHVLLEGKLMFQSGKTEESGKLKVLAFGVEVLRPARVEAT
jgi:single-stranded DNA-binding protein